MKNLNRRHILKAGAALAVLPGLAATAASAQETSVDVTKLMVPPPLGDRVLGNPDAKVTMIEYASATCPHCAHFSNNTFPTLKTEYIDTGKVKYIFREFPFDDLALAAFMLARCAPEDKYYPMIEVLYEQQAEVDAQRSQGRAVQDRQARRLHRGKLQCLPQEHRSGQGHHRGPRQGGKGFRRQLDPDLLHQRQDPARQRADRAVPHDARRRPGVSAANGSPPAGVMICIELCRSSRALHWRLHRQCRITLDWRVQGITARGSGTV